jgi:spore coat protein A
MNVEKNHYRVRIVNSCNGRQLLLSFFDEEAKEDIPFQLYKADSCYYNNPLTLTKVEVPPAARVELVIDFALVKGKRIIVKNTLP